MKVRHNLRQLAITTILVLFSLTVFPVALRAQSSTFSQKAPTGTASLLVAANPTRSGLLIKNVGSVGVAIGNVSTVSYSTAVTAGFVIAPNQTLELTGAKDQLYGITAGSTGDLRIWEVKNGAANLHMERVATTGAANNASSTIMPASDGTDLGNGNVLVYNLSTAITPNSTTTATAAGTLAITSNATGIGAWFRSDGSKWQLMNNVADDDAGANLGTIATTSNTDDYVIVPFTGTVTGVDFSAVDALSASDTNYITFSITNLGQSGAGSTVLLLATAANTTKTTGGTALAANTKRSLSLTATGADLIVTKGDRLRVRAAATGTLANTVTFSKLKIYITRLS